MFEFYVIVNGKMIGFDVENVMYIECNENGSYNARFSNNSIICEVAK